MPNTPKQPNGMVTSTSGNPNRYYVIDYLDLKAAGAVTTIDFLLETLPPATSHLSSTIKHTTAVAGTSYSASTARLYFGPSGSLSALGAGALDVFAAVGTTDGTHSITSVTQVAGDVESDNQLIMRVTSTGGNLSAATAGEIRAHANFTRNSVA